MQPPVPQRSPRRGISRKGWMTIWTGIGIIAAFSIIVPLALTPGAVPHPQARRSTSTPSATATSPSPSPSPTAIPYPPPVWITASKAHINASVMPVGTDAQGAMAAPEGPNNDPIWLTTFWWEFGARPGEIGNAVIAGHLDRKDGSPAVFWWLRLLRVGDTISVRTAAGTTLQFVVTDVETYLNPTGGPDDPVLQRIFGPATTANLNLITCAGDWTGKEYNKKLVVYTTLAP
jgi:hypothetical protein